VLGMDPIRDRAAVRRSTGVLLQRSGFVADLSVTETLQMWAATVTDARPLEESLAMLDLEDRAETRMRALSGGEQRRVDLACTLMGLPEVVMLDEPTTGLDPESRRRVWRLIRNLRDEGATVLLTTHYLEEAEALADDLSIMRAGEIVRSGTPAQIVADHPSEISFSAPGATLPDLCGARVSHDGGRTILYVDDVQPELTRLLRWAEEYDVRLDRLAARTASLESVFLGIADQRAPDKNDEPDGSRILEGSDR
jgi:ABC-2 type transport system ATP-binding protein